MFFVAVTSLASDVDSEAYAIAAALSQAVYDVKLHLTGVLPRVFVSTPDAAEAARVAQVLRARGNGVVTCDSRTLPPPASLHKVQRFTFDAAAFHSNGESLAWSRLAAVVSIAARTEVVRTTSEKVLVNNGRTSAMVEREHIGHEHVLDRAAYLFKTPNPDGSLEPPWLLHEREAQYLSLGPRMRATRRENFITTIAVLREHAPMAIFDDRFVKHSLTATELIAVAGSASPQTAAAPRGIDVMVHLLALALFQGRGGPYRAAPRG